MANMNNGTFENGSTNMAMSESDGSLQESLLFLAMRQRWTILLTTALFLVAAFVYILKATPIFTSESRLYVEQSGPRIINEYEGVMARSSNYLYTQGELLRSTLVLGPVVENPKIAKLKTFADVDNPVAFLRNNLRVSIGRKDDVITVSFESPYPVEAAQIVNELVSSYITYHRERRRDTASEVLKILTKEKEKRDAALEAKFQEMIEFTEENGIVSFDDKGGNIVFERLRVLSNELNLAEMATLNAKANYDAVQSMVGDAAKIRQFAAASAGESVRVYIADKETQLQAELRQTETELKDARFHCTEEHPSVQALKAKIDRINQELEKEAQEFANAYVEVMRLRWITAKERQDEVLASFEDQYEEAKGFGTLSAQYSLRQSELARAERICEIVDNRIKELNVTAQDVEALRISTLEVARPADSPSRPQKTRTMAMALALGLMCGASLAFIRDWLDFRLRSSEEVSAILGIPVLGVVPKMSVNRAIAIPEPKVMASFRSIAGSGGRAGEAVPSIDADKTVTERTDVVRRGQMVHLESKSIVAEAYRTIRTAVFFGAPKEDARTIHITSPAPGDGKSTLVSNLAIAMTQAGQKTLIIDADFRKPVQHKIFEIDDDKGLSGVLVGRDTIEQAIRPDVLDGLDIMACGPEVPNPSELLNSDVFNETLKRLSERYDRIIIDSPPVAPVADAQILAAACDTTLLVLRAEKSTRKQAQHARDGLFNVGGQLLGAVVNDVQQKRGQYGYYSSYGNYGYYGKREKKTG